MGWGRSLGRVRCLGYLQPLRHGPGGRKRGNGLNEGVQRPKEARVRLMEDRQQYDRLQSHVLQAITESVRGHLRLLLSGRVPADLNTVTANIVFSVASIIDGSGEMDDQGTPVMPVLGFATSETRDELLFAELGYGSWMHEYAHGASEHSE